MKTLVFKKLSVLLFLVISHANIVSGAVEVTKTYEKIFPLTGAASLEIENRYGSIDIKNWDNDEISVHVLVTVSNSSRESAERQLALINVNLGQRENAIRAITEIDQRGGRSGSRWFSSGNDGQSISIDYTVYAPRETDLKITHRYGDVFINEATGHTFIDLRYGNLQANRISRNNTRPLSEINLAYSTKVNITEADWLKVNMRYSDISVERCRALVVAASYSKLRVERASSVVAESRYGEFFLGDITNFVTESAYTNYSIRSIGNTLDVESRYGNIRVENMPASFSKIRFINSYGNMRIGLDPEASYHIESTAGYGSVNIPSGGRVNRISSGRQATLSGVVGPRSEPSATVEISTRYGNVDLTAR
ncbi:MAG: DUF4097 family beta strand repeat-containing protein [Bacteroidales bacterium]